MRAIGRLWLKRAFLQFRGERVPLLDVHDSVVDCSGGGVVLRAPSGAGKSTFFRLIAGWYRGGTDDSEEIAVFEGDFDPFCDVAFVGAHRTLLPWFSVKSNVRVQIGSFDVERVMSLLAKVDLDEKVLALWPSDLSLGMYKRVELLITLLRGPRLVLLDEFFGSIDKPVKRRVYDVLREMSGETDFIASSHEDDVVDMFEGRILEFKRRSGDGAIVGLERRG